MVKATEEAATAVADRELDRARLVAAAVPDPEIPVVTVADLGILRRIERLADGSIDVAVSPTYTGCPATSAIVLAIETALRDAGIQSARVRLVLAPPWTTDDITEDGRRKLLAYGIAPPAAKGRGSLLFASETVACPRCGSEATTRISDFGATPCKALWRCTDCREPFEYFKCL